MATRRAKGTSRKSRRSRGGHRKRSGNARLRPAAELSAERASRRATSQERTTDKYLADAIRLIEEAHAKGLHEVSYLTFPSQVVSKLKAAGYRVRLLKASGMGDVDTHLIEWD